MQINLKNIIAQFFPNDSPKFILPFGNGHINDTYKITFPTQNFLLQRINHHIFQQPEIVMNNIILVAKHLQKKQFSDKILTPIFTKNNQPFFKDEIGNYWRIFPFFENTISLEKVENENQAFEAAKAFGAFSKALFDIEIEKIKPTIPNFQNGLLRLEQFEKALKNASQERLKKTNLEIKFIQHNQDIFHKIANLNLPIRITHNDTKINNVLFDKNGKNAVAVIDWDTIMPGNILFDFGDMVRTSTNSAIEDEADLSKVKMRPKILEALKNGFLSEMINVLSPLEKAHLLDGGKWLILMQAMRFLTDYLNDDVYYKIKYAEHNLVRTRNQIQLYKSLLQSI